MKYYTVKEMAEVSGIKDKTLWMRISRKKMDPAVTKSVNNKGRPAALFSEEQFRALTADSNNLESKEQKKLSKKKQPAVYYKLSVMNHYDLRLYVKACCLARKEAEVMKAELEICGIVANVTPH